MSRRLRGVLVFLTMAFGASYALDYLAVLPRLGERSVVLIVLLLARMAVVSVAAATALAVEGARGWRGLRAELVELGLKPPPGGSWDAALLFPALLAVGGYALGSLALLAFPGFRVCEYMTQLGPVAGAAYAVFTHAAGLLAGLTVNLAAAVLEEVGWRGYLYSRLRGAGLPWAVAAGMVGVAWGLWHAPLVWAGFNYALHLPGECAGEPTRGPAALAAFTVFSVSLGAMLAAVREWCDTLYSPAAGHGTVNAVGGFYAALVVGDRLIAPPAGLAVSAGVAAVTALASLTGAGVRACRRGRGSWER